MARKQNKSPQQKPVPQVKAVVPKQQDKAKASFKLEIPSLPMLTPYLPGILLFFVSVIIGLVVYKDYGIGYDESLQRDIGLLSYNYAFYSNQDLLFSIEKYHGQGYELLLIFIEKLFRLSDSRDIYLMRHLVTHILFLASALSLYVLAYRLFKNKFIATLAFLMLVFAPRLYAHSFINTKDMPFLCMFIITLTCCQIAFEKNKPILFFIVGLILGYTSAIRVMGVMLGGFILFFLLIDLVINVINKGKDVIKILFNILFFLVGFCLLLYLAWPFLWKHPVGNFLESLSQFSHFPWNGRILVNGVYAHATNLSWTYFPAWFLVTNPEIWLIAGFAGIIWIGIDFIKSPLVFLKNSRDRNFVLYLLCFFVPVMAVIILHSVIYDDWRHLYFVYPSFILVALYFINKLLQTKYKKIVQGVCILQFGLIGWFMIDNHPFQQVYFNNFVSHKVEYLHNNYDMDYWGASFKQGLEHLLDADKSGIINANCYDTFLLKNNMLLLPEEDRKRIHYADFNTADYLITNFRNDPYADIFTNIEYSITVLNSSILCIYKVGKDPARQTQVCNKLITNLKNAIAGDFGNTLESTYTIGYSYYILKLYDSAIFYFYKTIALDSACYNAEKGLGHAYLDKQNYDSAEVYYKKYLDHTPDDADVINNLGVLYLNTKKYQQAIEQFNKGIALTHGNAVAYSNLGRSCYAAGQYNAALENFKKEFTLDSRNKSDYPVIAACWQMLGKKDSVIKYQAMAK